MTDRSLSFKSSFMTRLERFMSRRRKSETLAGAIKYAESIVEHTDCDGRCGCSNPHTAYSAAWQPTVYLGVGDRGKIRQGYSAWYQSLKGQTTKQLETRPSRRLLRYSAQAYQHCVTFVWLVTGVRTEDLIASKPRPDAYAGSCLIHS